MFSLRWVEGGSIRALCVNRQKGSIRVLFLHVNGQKGPIRASFATREWAENKKPPFRMAADLDFLGFCGLSISVGLFLLIFPARS
jgi:hypothetical protein